MRSCANTGLLHVPHQWQLSLDRDIASTGLYITGARSLREFLVHNEGLHNARVIHPLQWEYNYSHMVSATGDLQVGWHPARQYMTEKTVAACHLG